MLGAGVRMVTPGRSSRARDRSVTTTTAPARVQPQLQPARRLTSAAARVSPGSDRSTPSRLLPPQSWGRCGGLLGRRLGVASVTLRGRGSRSRRCTGPRRRPGRSWLDVRGWSARGADGRGMLDRRSLAEPPRAEARRARLRRRASPRRAAPAGAGLPAGASAFGARRHRILHHDLVVAAAGDHGVVDVRQHRGLARVVGLAGQFDVGLQDAAVQLLHQADGLVGGQLQRLEKGRHLGQDGLERGQGVALRGLGSLERRCPSSSGWLSRRSLGRRSPSRRSFLLMPPSSRSSSR